MEYPKINTLWKRRQPVLGQVIHRPAPLMVGEFSRPEFSTIFRWRVDEKIDGTNVRVEMASIGGVPRIAYLGRKEDSALPNELLEYLQEEFTLEKVTSKYPHASRIVLFGEGFGPKIQACGGSYSPKVCFILFDVFMDGQWLSRDEVKEVGQQLGVLVVPELGVMTTEQAVEFVKSRPLSRCSHIPQVMEGIVCRSNPFLKALDGSLVMWKLKCRDFDN